MAEAAHLNLRSLHVPQTGAGPKPFELSTGPIRVVLIDSETSFTRVATKRAEALGWPHRTFAAPPPVAELARIRPGAVVLAADDLPDGPWEFLAVVASELPDCGLIVTSYQSTVAERVRALRVGADDWLPKPVHPEEFVARVQAVVRRRQTMLAGSAPESVIEGELQVRPERFQAYVGGESVGLTRREYELLELLALAGGRVLEREEIYRRVWGYAMVRGDRSVDVFIGKIRSKLASASPQWRYVHTHFGVGYRFGAEPLGD